uniref:Activator of basal transcription 1 n=1 Tax=Strigops habroptila TaxID=2489341 RepID=A0A672U6E5_STRHB
MGGPGEPYEGLGGQWPPPSGGPRPPPAEEEEAAEAEGSPPPRRVVPGVLYLSFLPPGFGPRQARALLGAHGELGRVFLQPRGGGVRRRRQRPGAPGGSFAEGWVEFRDKRAAKRAAALLHGAAMSPRPRSRFRHHCWSIKYLPGFRWPHLSERLSYERQVRAQRLRVEVAQAKREGGFYTRRRAPPADTAAPPAPTAPSWGFTQTPTEEEIWGRKKRPPPARPPRSLLQKVFGGGG